jgi:hypothetical protein
MLQTPKSNPNQKWKYLFLLPILALFIYSFNRVEVQKFNNFKFNPIDVLFTITKETSDADLQAIKDFFKSQDIIFDISQLGRNTTNEIIELSLKVSSTEFNTQFNSKSSTPIEPISIKYNSKLKKVLIGNAFPQPTPDYMMVIDKKMGNDSMHEIMEWKGNGHEKKVCVISDNETGNHKKVKHITIVNNDSLKNIETEIEWVGENGEKQIIPKSEKMQQVIFIEENNNNQNTKEGIEKKYTILIKEDENGNIIYNVNGKEVSKEELEKIETGDIKEVNVVKKKKEIKKTR